jgi:hypothetical protein
MTQLPKLGQESIHETVRILVPGYFALFAVFTLYPQLFDGDRGVALALIGGVGLGITLYGVNLQNYLWTLKPKFGSLLRSEEKEKIETMMEIIKALNKRDEKTKIDNIDNCFGFCSHFWTSFSYGYVSESIRARQRIHASMFYLYANCSLIMIGYFLFVLMVTILPSFSQFIMYQPNPNYDALRMLGALALTGFFWLKAKEELLGSMSFQKSAMYLQHKKLYKNFMEAFNLQREIHNKGD